MKRTTTIEWTTIIADPSSWPADGEYFLMELDESSWQFSRTGSSYGDEFGNYEFIKAIGRRWAPMPKFQANELDGNEKNKDKITLNFDVYYDLIKKAAEVGKKDSLSENTIDNDFPPEQHSVKLEDSLLCLKEEFKTLSRWFTELRGDFRIMARMLEDIKISKKNWQSIEELDPHKMVLLRNNLFLPGAVFYGRVWINEYDERELFTYKLKKDHQCDFGIFFEPHGKLGCDSGWEWCEVPQ